MKDEIQVYHHLGLGDHIICNGLIRELCKNYRKVYCFVKESNFYSVSFMYRDQPKIELISVKNDYCVKFKINKNIDLIQIGFENLDVSNRKFDESFYNQLGYEFSLRWDNFYVERDYKTELELFHKLNLNNVPYIFIHDDASRRFVIDLKKIREDLKKVRVSDLFISEKIKAEFQKYTIFHWLLVLENSKEIHCMDSSFKCLVDSLPNFDNKKLFYHRYVRGLGPKAVSSMKRNWTVIDNPSLLFYAANSIGKRYYKTKKKLYNLKNRFGKYLFIKEYLL